MRLWLQPPQRVDWINKATGPALLRASLVAREQGQRLRSVLSSPPCLILNSATNC